MVRPDAISTSPEFQLRLHALEEPADSEAQAPTADDVLPAQAAGIEDKQALPLMRQAAHLEPNDADCGRGLAGGMVSLIDGIRRLTLPAAVVSAIFVLVVAAILYFSVRVGSVYFTWHLLLDDIAGIASAPVVDDADIVDRLQHAVRDRGAEAYFADDSCRIQTRVKWRRIVCRYEVPVELVPGWRHSFAFRIDVERPYFTPENVLRLGPG